MDGVNQLMTDTNMTSDFTQSVDAAFSSSADYYHRQAELQKECASRLANALDPWLDIVPPGQILELGCGTGFFTQHLLRYFPNRKLIITDLSEPMLAYAQKELPEAPNTHFSVMDAEAGPPAGETYALITGNYVAQWFSDPAKTLEPFAKQLDPGGLMLLSFPGDESYPEWRQACLDLGLPYSGNPFPNVEKLAVQLSMGPYQIDFYEDSQSEQFDDLYAFFRHLKKSGTAASRKQTNLTPAQLRLLDSYWREQCGGRLTVTYHNVFFALKKNR
ncbi:MAG: methyltransferase domain-containing protein [Balneolaceae bacterium]